MPMAPTLEILQIDVLDFRTIAPGNAYFEVKTISEACPSGPFQIPSAIAEHGVSSLGLSHRAVEP
jgi:hypothetical protein